MPASLFTTARDVWSDIEKKNLMLAAAGISYYLLLSFFPALTVLSAALSYLPFHNALGNTTSILGYVVPPQVMTMIEDALTRIVPLRLALLSFGLITTLWIASVAFNGLILGLDMVHGSNASRPLWVSRILAVGLTIAVGALLLTGVVLTSFGPMLWGLGPYVQWSVSAAVLFTAIEVLYVLGPSLPLSQRRTIPGAAAATVLWLVLAWGLDSYFLHFGELKFATVFGFLAAPAVFMTWIYCCAIAILLGAEINSRLSVLA